MKNIGISPRVYVACVSCLEDDGLFDAAYRNVSEQRRNKTDKLRFDKDKRLSVGAELLLRFALKEADICAHELKFGYGENSKPYLENAGVSFNLSHSEDFVMCAVANKEVGCDIQKKTDVNMKIAERFFTESEYKKIEALSEEQRKDVFFRYWTLKESYIKALGTGMSTPLNSFEIVFGDDIKVVGNEDCGRYVFFEYPETAGYQCAVCFTEETERPNIITVDLRKIISFQ